ncbi:Rap30/74 interaction domain-containing protein, partial [Mytilinidion resinicola]
GFKVFSLVTTKRAMMEGLRHHVMRLQQSKERAPVKIVNESEFTRPIRLHRRDPRAPPAGAGATVIDEDPEATLEEDKERERAEIQKEERRRQREENQAKIAPSTTKKMPAFQKKTEQIYRPDDTPEAQKRSKLRYEEALPWHLEDFDNKQTWVGSYEAELSDKHIMIVPDHKTDGTPQYRMVPLERWYKFISKSKGKQFTADEADKKWNTVGSVPSFIKNTEERIIKREREEYQKNRGPGKMKTRIAGRGDDDAPPRIGEDGMMIKVEEDADDIDFNYEDDFADDEEGLNGLFEGDAEETKAAEEKIRRDRLAARIFDLRDESKVDVQEELDKEEAAKQKGLQKQLRKALMKREKNYDYEQSDSDRYGSSSESEDDSDVERQKEKERREEEERKAAERPGVAKEGDKPASGASTKGTNTPSGQHKPVDVSKPNSKKRPGSPNLSEASGNESARKKHKKKHRDGSGKGSLVSVRLSDAQGAQNSSLRAAGSPSDSEITDGGRRKQSLKLRLGTGRSPNGTPGGSRAGSPDTGAERSRATSPLSAAGSTQTMPGSTIPVPTIEQIKALLRPEGVKINEISSIFKGRLAPKDNHAFIQRVKALSVFDKDKGLLFP